MKRAMILTSVIMALSVVSSGHAFAAAIGFAPASQTAGVGDSLSVDIVISDLAGEIVSAYDLDVTYDASVLSATAVSFFRGGCSTIGTDWVRRSSTSTHPFHTIYSRWASSCSLANGETSAP